MSYNRSTATQQTCLPIPALPQDLERAILSGQIAAEYMIQNIPTDEIGFRWIGPNAFNTRKCVADVGMFSQGQGHGPIWQGDRVTNHCNGINRDSEYLSISTSPQRIVNFMTQARSSTTGEVAVVNLKTLQIMQRPCELTTVLARQFDLKTGGNNVGRTKYVTDTHMLVYEFIPACCILGYLDSGAFESICISQGITNQTDPACKMKLVWPTLSPLVRKASNYSVQPEFTTPVKSEQQTRTVFPLTPDSSGSGTGPQSRYGYQQTRADRRFRGQAPSPSPSPTHGRPPKKEDRDIIDLTKVEVIDLEDPFI